MPSPTGEGSFYVNNNRQCLFSKNKAVFSAFSHFFRKSLKIAKSEKCKNVFFIFVQSSFRNKEISHHISKQHTQINAILLVSECVMMWRLCFCGEFGFSYLQNDVHFLSNSYGIHISQCTSVHINAYQYTSVHISTHAISAHLYTSVHISTHQYILVYRSVHIPVPMSVHTNAHQDTPGHISAHQYTYGRFPKRLCLFCPPKRPARLCVTRLHQEAVLGRGL